MIPTRNLPIVGHKRLSFSHPAVAFTALAAQADGLTAGKLFSFASQPRPRGVQAKVGQAQSEVYNMLPCY